MKTATAATCRIVIVSATADPWIRDAALTVHEAATRCGCELVLLAAGDRGSIPAPSFIDVRRLRFELRAEDVRSCPLAVGADLAALMERQRMYRERQGGGIIADEQQLESEMRTSLAQAVLVLRLVAPDLVIVWNGTFAPRALYALAADGLSIPRIFAEKGFLPNSFYFDGSGINAASDLARLDEIPEPESDDLHRFEELTEALDRGGDSAWEQPRRRDLADLRKRLGIPSDRRVVLFPAQVDHDSNLICFSPHFSDTAAALRWLGMTLDPRRYVVVAKPHPKGRLAAAAMQEALGAAGIVADEINILDVIALADCVVTINSAVAFEAAIRGVPIVLLGEGLLSARGFAVRYRGETASDLVDRAITEHAERAVQHRAEALRFGAFLMSQLYAYRGDPTATERVLRRHLPPPAPAAAHRLSLAEVAPLVRAVEIEEVARRFSGRSVAALTLRKLLARAAGRQRR